LRFFAGAGSCRGGFLNYGRDGRMFAIIVKENRPKPTDLTKMTDQERAELFKSVIAYAGTIKVEGRRVVNSADISWNEKWRRPDRSRGRARTPLRARDPTGASCAHATKGT
jgi:hypothetical protein